MLFASDRLTELEQLIDRVAQGECVKRFDTVGIDIHKQAAGLAGSVDFEVSPKSPAPGETYTITVFLQNDSSNKTKIKALKASQKVMIWDVCRFNPERVRGRRDPGPMTPALFKALTTAPEGVQVMVSSSPGERAGQVELRARGVGRVGEHGQVTLGEQRHVHVPPLDRDLLRQPAQRAEQRHDEVGDHLVLGREVDAVVTR